MYYEKELCFNLEMLQKTKKYLMNAFRKNILMKNTPIHPQI